MSYFIKIQNSYKSEASNVCDLTPYSDYLEGDAEVHEYQPGHSGTWHEPAYPSEYNVLLNAVLFDVNDIEDSDEHKECMNKLKKLKAGDKVKINLVGKAELSEHYNESGLEYEVNEITVKKTSWRGNTITIFCKEYYSGQGRTPPQSQRGR